MDIKQILLDSGLDTSSMSKSEADMVITELAKSLYNRVMLKVAHNLPDEDLSFINENIETNPVAAFARIDEKMPDFNTIVENTAKDVVEEYRFISS